MTVNNFVCDTDASVRADTFLAEQLEITRSYAGKLLENGNATCNEKVISKSFKVKKGFVLTVTVPDPVELDVKPENIPLDIIYEDSCLLIVNKPKGMVVHPAPGNYSGTLVNALLYYCKGGLSGINGVMRPGIVHRIDKDTSGLLMVAKNDIAHNFLAEQIKEHTFTREYRAVVHGVLKEDSGTVNAPIGRHPVKRKQMAVTAENSKNAVTHYEVIKRFVGYTYIKCRLETGRTHQIRVHMAYLGYPIAGDTVYGPKKSAPYLNGQCLHAAKLGFIHPETKKYIEFECDLPDYFKNFLNKIN